MIPLDLFEAIHKRSSVRSFKNEPLPRSVIEKIIDAARRAPSARNVQPWDFVVVTSSKTRGRIKEIVENGPYIADAPVCIAVFCEDTKYYLEDGCAATQNILLAVTGLGLGACWIAGDKKPFVETVRLMLGVPKQYKLVSLVAVGRPVMEPMATGKRRLPEVLHWERWQGGTPEQIAQEE